MATSVFKGSIKAGAISAKFQSDFSNVDSDLLMANYADSTGGNVQVPRVAIAPGGSGTVSVNAVKAGGLEVTVDTGHDQESGRLRVEGGGRVDDEPIQGPVRWVYMVIE